MTYEVISPGFPDNYRGKYSCRWTLESPPDTTMRLFCDKQIETMNTKNECNSDKLVVSRGGKDNFQDGQVYWGQDNKWEITTDTISNRLTIDHWRIPVSLKCDTYLTTTTVLVNSKQFLRMLLLFIQIISLLLVQIVSFDARTYDPNCKYSQQAVLGQTYYVFNPEYPNRYGPSKSCRWIVESPPNTIVQMYCEDFDVPSTSTQDCSGDVMIVSTTGKEDLSNGNKYCGKGQFSINSETNKMVIGFFSTKNTKGGKFLCTLEVVEPTPTCDCGWRNTRRIVGGVDTGVNEFPNMVALVDLDASSIFCGGSIISKNYIVTAAHCLVNAELSNTGVLVGDWDISSGSDTPKAKIYNSQEFLIHQSFNITTFANDIALVKTTTPIVFSLEVGPACLPILYTTTNFVGTNVIELGWGTLGFGYPPSDILQKVDLRVISLNTCKETYSRVQNTQFCTYADNKDSCQGDSGGPALWQRNNTTRLQLLGIISTGNACAIRNIPGINTRVVSYIAWIRRNTPTESYCVKA